MVMGLHATTTTMIKAMMIFTPQILNRNSSYSILLSRTITESPEAVQIGIIRRTESSGIRLVRFRTRTIVPRMYQADVAVEYKP